MVILKDWEVGRRYVRVGGWKGEGFICLWMEMNEVLWLVSYLLFKVNDENRLIWV